MKSHEFYCGRLIRWLFSFYIFYAEKRKNPCPQKHLKDFGYGEYSKREQCTDFSKTI